MASIDAMKGISNAVITSSLVFMAVFIPVSFMGGTSGTFYTQFGLTMAVAVGISAVNALTLSPALCALLLRPYINEDGTQKNNFAARFRGFQLGFRYHDREIQECRVDLYQTQMVGMVVAGLLRSVACIPDEYDKDESGAGRRPGCGIRQCKYSGR